MGPRFQRLSLWKDISWVPLEALSAVVFSCVFNNLLLPTEGLPTPPPHKLDHPNDMDTASDDASALMMAAVTRQFVANADELHACV